ncbi:MAG: radical SAM/Cys-rich domain protein [Deltaproteobacteria bacterium]|nr:MAG: radical SAM/Cys-rich domain protein [Deltaproteobacteria bacterium]
MNEFSRTVRQQTGADLKAEGPSLIQVNVGLKCNLACRHCHVEGSPARTEQMDWQTMTSVLKLAEAFPGIQVDITGGAPELNPHFFDFILALRQAGHPVQVRTNLTVLFEPGQEETAAFFRDQQVQLVASLPCYLDRNVDAQRGQGVYRRSLDAIRLLNQLGYGRDEALPLNLVYNPGGAFLPPDQQSLEQDYRDHLEKEHGVVFTRLLTIANMPIGRFLEDLRSRNEEQAYRLLLEDSFNPATVAGLMCRHQICIAWDGSLSDCDFNQVLGMGLADGLPGHIDELDPAVLAGRTIHTGIHCFGCTAGCGSSCGGALVA